MWQTSWTLWTLMTFRSQTQQQYGFQSSFNTCIVNFTFYILHCTLKSMWMGSLHHAKSTSNHPSVKMRRLIINPTFNQPMQQILRDAEANYSFTYMHKTIVEIHPQETRSNGLVGLVLSLHHLYYHRLSCRAFPVVKEITITTLNLSMKGSVDTWVAVSGT